MRASNSKGHKQAVWRRCIATATPCNLWWAGVHSSWLKPVLARCWHTFGSAGLAEEEHAVLVLTTLPLLHDDTATTAWFPWQCQALSVASRPGNLPHSLQLLASLVDDVWHAAGASATDSSWYSQRVLLAGVYTCTELYMLTDCSPGFQETWQVRRWQDAADALVDTGSVGMPVSVREQCGDGNHASEFCKCVGRGCEVCTVIQGCSMRYPSAVRLCLQTCVQMLVP